MRAQVLSAFLASAAILQCSSVARAEDYVDVMPDDDPEKEGQPRVLTLSKPLGQVAGLAITIDYNLLVFHRADRVWNAQSFDRENRFNSTWGPIHAPTLYVVNVFPGTVIKEHGNDTYYMPHGLTVDHEGNIWVTDVGLHQVIKMDKDFNVLLTLGEKLVPGSDTAHFCKPTDVAVMRNGDFFVADGYCNSRIMKFSKDGVFITSFGKPNDITDEQEVKSDGSFALPHSLALVQDLKILCVADRENERIQCFSAGNEDEDRFTAPGTFISKSQNIGRVYAIRITGHYLVGITVPNIDTDDFQLFIMDMDNGKAKVALEDIQNAHAVAIVDDGLAFVGTTGPNQIIQIMLAKSQRGES